MADTFSKEKRTEIMRSVKSRGNESTEILLIKFFKEQKITGWRRKYNLFGKPDFVFIRNRIAIFTDGCFWHGHGCRNIKPKDNAAYWDKKISRNKERDKLVTEHLTNLGWNVIRIWECEIKKGDIVRLYELIK